MNIYVDGRSLLAVTEDSEIVRRHCAAGQVQSQGNVQKQMKIFFSLIGKKMITAFWLCHGKDQSTASIRLKHKQLRKSYAETMHSRLKAPLCCTFVLYILYHLFVS